MVLATKSGPYSRISPEWSGMTAVLIASGPSLSSEQIDAVEEWRHQDRCRVVAINDNYLRAPWADVLYFADVRWYRWHLKGIDIPRLGMKAKDVRDRFGSFSGVKLAVENCNESFGPEVHVLRNLSTVDGTRGRLSDEPTGVFTGQNSGYQAINVAALAGAVRIILLGFDMKASSAERSHWFGDHPKPTDVSIFRRFRSEFDQLAPEISRRGIEVINATSDSDLESFPRADLMELVRCGPGV